MKQQNASISPVDLDFLIPARKTSAIKLNCEFSAIMRASHTRSSELP
jgi:hypothetical protein